MKLLSLFLGICLSANVFAQETVVNDADVKPRTLNAPFTAITVTDGIEVYLTQGNEESVAVSYSDDKFADKFKTIVEEGILKIYYDSKSANWASNNKRKLRAYVSFKSINMLNASGGASVKMKSVLQVSEISMRFSSGAAFNGEVKVLKMTVEQNSGSVMNMNGNADQVSIDVSSGAMFKGYEFVTNYCDAQASSGAGVRISIEKELTAKANSGGGIHYKGNGVIKDVNVNSGGVVKKGK